MPAASLLTFFTSLLRTQPATPQPFTARPLDVVLSVLDELDQSSLAALSSTCRALRALATPALFARIELGSCTTLQALVDTLETRPALGALIKSFAERRSSPFLALEPQPSHLLARLLEFTPRLQTLRIHSPLDIDLPQLARLTDLRELELGDATRKTVAVLAHVRPLATLRVHCWPAALPAGARPPADLAAAIGAYLDRARGTLTTLELDAAVLAALPAPLPRVAALELHGCNTHPEHAAQATARCSSPCAWCAPVGAAWENRNMSASSRAGRKKPARPFSVLRWLASHVAALF